MGKLILTHNGKPMHRTFESVMVQDANGRVYGPFNFNGTITLVTGNDSPKDRRVLEFIKVLDARTRPIWMPANFPLIHPIVAAFLGIITFIGFMMIASILNQ